MLSSSAVQRRNGRERGLSYRVLQGVGRRPVILVTAGIHGTEVAGVRAALLLAQMKVHKGTLIVVPKVNKQALLEHKRGTPDVNRSFSRFATDPPTTSIARELQQLVRRHQPDYCIDLHEADGFHRLDERKLGQTLIAYPHEDTINLARRVTRRINRRIRLNHRKFSVKTGKLRGSFRTYAGDVKGVRAITVETCMQQPLRIRTRDQLTLATLLCEEMGMTFRK